MIRQSNWLLNFVNFNNSGCQSLAGFGIPWTVFRIPTPRILPFQKKEFPGFWRFPGFRNPDFLTCLGESVTVMFCFSINFQLIFNFWRLSVVSDPVSFVAFWQEPITYQLLVLVISDMLAVWLERRHKPFLKAGMDADVSHFLLERQAIKTNKQTNGSSG